MSWEGALDYWAEKAGCAELDFVGSSQFARVWTYSVVYGLVMTVGITVPFRWCTHGKAAVKIYDIPDDPEEGHDPTTPKSTKTTKTNKTYKTYDANVSDPTPNLEEAKKHLVHTSATQNRQWLNPFCTPTYKLSELGGTGTELYFRTLRNLTFIFAYMTALTAPLVAFCWLRSFGPDTGQFLLKTTIGNLGEYIDADVIDPWKRVVRLGCEGMEITKLTGIFGWLDFSAVVIFLIYLIWARFWQIPRMAEADDLEQVTPKDYAVCIESLPAMIGKQAEYEQRLEQHLLERLRYTRQRRPSPWELPEPTVEEIVLVRDYKGRLHELTERAKLEISVGVAEAHAKGKPSKRVDKLKKQLQKLEEKLGSKLDGEELLPVVRAYVILSNTEDVQNLLFDYRFAKYKLFRMCQFNARRFEGTAIRVTRAPQPTDIIWENQDIGFWNRTCRQFTVFLIFFLILSVSIAFIYLTTVASKATSKTQVSYLGVPECDPVDQQFDLEGNEQYKCLVQNAANWTMDYAISEGGDILSCWCTAQGYEALIHNSGLRDACGPWFLELATSIAIATGSSLIVTVINLILQLVITYLAEFERPLSHTALNSSMIQKAFYAQTLNTGFVLFVVNYFAPEAIRNAVLAIPGVGFLLFRGPFSEITRGWYAVVGVTLVTNMLINSFVPASVTLAKMIMTKFMRWCGRGRVAHQAELIELYTNPEFDIKQKYAQLLTTIFVTLIYGSGLPFLYFLAAVFMCFQFWADKLNLLWGSRRPPHYDTKMAKEAIDSMFYVIPLHCVLAILMFGQTCVFPSNPIGGDLGDLANQGASESPGLLAKFFPQFTRESTWMFVFLLALCIVLWVLRLLSWIIGGTAGTAKDFVVALCCPRWRKSQPSMDEIKEALAKGERSISGHTIDVASTMNWEKAFGHIESTFPPASYRFERHPQCSNIAHLLRPSSPSRPNTGDTQGAANSKLRSAEAEAPHAPSQSPVKESLARGFLEALEAEYFHGTAEAVGKFFDKEGAESEQEKLLKFEDQVRAAEDKQAAISELRRSWGL